MHPAQPGRGGGAAAHTRAMAGVFDIDLDQPEDAGSDEELEEGVRGGSPSRRGAGREREAAAGSGARGRPEGRERGGGPRAGAGGHPAGGDAAEAGGGRAAAGWVAGEAERGAGRRPGPRR